MGTEVLRPQDCLIRPALSLSHHRKPNPRPHQRPSRQPLSSPRPETKKRRGGSPNPAKVAGDRPAMGQVAILKRDESLAVEAGRRNVRPSMVTKQIRVADLNLVAGGRADVYAGTAFEQSPSPRALPLPTFAARSAAAAVNSSATEDLRRLLRLC